MITPINTLPSGGYCKSKLKEITLKPLVLEEVNKYCSMKYPSTIEKMVWDIENLIMSIPGWEDLSAYDVTGLLFMRKYISATFKPDLKVTVKIKKGSIELLKISAGKHYSKKIQKVIIAEEEFMLKMEPGKTVILKSVKKEITKK